MKIFGLHILTAAQLAAVGSFALSELDKAVAAAKQTELGATALAVIKTAEDGNLTGPQKLAKAMADVVPAVVDYAAKGGITAALADAETFGRALIESTLDDIKVTGVGRIARAILALVKG